MNFLCVCYYDADAFAKFSESDFKRLREICDPHDEEFKASGPYVQTPEPFGAFFIIEAEDMDEAEIIARLHPGTHLGGIMKGGIEIRPIRTLELL